MREVPPCGSGARPSPRPTRPRRMVLTDQSFHVHRPPAHLLTVHVSNQPLLVALIFLAHAASLRHDTFFARMKCAGVSSQLHPAYGPPKLVLGLIVRATRLKNRRLGTRSRFSVLLRGHPAGSCPVGSGVSTLWLPR